MCQVTQYGMVVNKTKSFPACRLYSGEIEGQKQIGCDKFEEVKVNRVKDIRDRLCCVSSVLSEELTFEQRCSEEGAI